MGGVLFLRDYHAGKQEYSVQKIILSDRKKKYIHIMSGASGTIVYIVQDWNIFFFDIDYGRIHLVHLQMTGKLRTTHP